MHFLQFLRIASGRCGVTVFRSDSKEVLHECVDMKMLVLSQQANESCDWEFLDVEALMIFKSQFMNKGNGWLGVTVTFSIHSCCDMREFIAYY